MTTISSLAPTYAKQHWKAGELFAYSHMDPAKEGFAADQFEATIEVPDKNAPDGTLITCRTPEAPATKGPRGFASIRHGNVAAGAPPVTVPVRQIGALKRLEDDFALTFDALGKGESNVLFDCFFLRDAKDHKSKVLELGVIPYPSSQAIAYAKTGKDLGAFTDRFGRAWKMPSLPGGYVMPIPVTPFLGGTIDRLEMLRWIIGKGVASADLWWTGTALGLEPIGGTTQLRVDRWSPVVV